MDLVQAFAPADLGSPGELPVNQLTAERRDNINKLLHFGESQHWGVFFLNDAHRSEDFTKLHEPPHALYGTPSSALMPWVYRPSDAKTFEKRTYNGCAGTPLVEELRNSGVVSIIIIGTSTGKCVLHTLLGLRKAGFQDITLIADACADLYPSRHRQALRQLCENQLATILLTTDILPS